MRQGTGAPELAALGHKHQPNTSRAAFKGLATGNRQNYISKKVGEAYGHMARLVEVELRRRRARRFEEGVVGSRHIGASRRILWFWNTGCEL